ncbi:hypothetical protein PRIPAC_80522, partial [Pristionchus pacificus]|uniref:Uncharacterized protein n=1 Tax=Pristionchus pacificus TaxID=54126 RepID=A0A2A6CKK6_PRIPA
IRDSYSIVQAMVPMYYMSTSLKLSELACGVTSAMFLMYHTRLRWKTCSRAFALLYGENDSAISTEIYFDMLLESWRDK